VSRSDDGGDVVKVKAKDGRGTSPRVRLPNHVEKSLPQERVTLLADRHLAASWPRYTCEIASAFHRNGFTG
jgi:hypothetical protein